MPHYSVVQLGVGVRKPKHTTKPMRGHFAKAGVEPQRKLAEFRVSEDALLDVGVELSVEHFLVGQKIDVTGTSTGKGLPGAMQRHNFGGLRPKQDRKSTRLNSSHSCASRLSS